MARSGTARSRAGARDSRVGMAYAFTRAFMTPLEEYREHVTKEVLERHPPRFATLMSQGVPAGSTESGPDLEKVFFAVGSASRRGIDARR